MQSARKPILKPTGYVPQSTYQRATQLYEAAAEVYASLSASLVRKGAPETIAPGAFTDSEESLQAVVQAYHTMTLCKQNKHLIQDLPLPPAMDPESWAHTLLLQWFHVQAKLRSGIEPARLHKIEDAKTRSLDEEDDAPPLRPKRLRLDPNHYERAFAKDSADLEPEVSAHPARAFDGVSPVCHMLDALLVDRSDSSTPRAHTAHTTSSRLSLFIAAHPSADEMGSVSSALRAASDHIKAVGTARLYPSHMRLNSIHVQSLDKMANYLAAKVDVLELKAAQSN